MGKGYIAAETSPDEWSIFWVDDAEPDWWLRVGVMRTKERAQAYCDFQNTHCRRFPDQHPPASDPPAPESIVVIQTTVMADPHPVPATEAQIGDEAIKPPAGGRANGRDHVADRAATTQQRLAIIRELWSTDMATGDIAKHLGITPSALEGYRYRFKLGARPTSARRTRHIPSPPPVPPRIDPRTPWPAERRVEQLPPAPAADATPPLPGKLRRRCQVPGCNTVFGSDDPSQLECPGCRAAGKRAGRALPDSQMGHSLAIGVHV